MSDFKFAVLSSTRRFPTGEEHADGFVCGPADKALFDGIFYRYGAELNHLLDFAGLTPSDNDLEQVRKAIQAMIPNNTDTYLLSVNADNNGGTLNANANNQFILKMSNGTTWTLNMPSGLKMLNNPVNLWSTGEIPSSTLPTNYNANISAHVPTTASALLVHVFFECDSGGDGLIATESTITVNGRTLGSAETGGGSGNGDNSWAADFHVPRTGNTLTAAVTNNYDAGGDGIYQTYGKLVGYFQ